MRTEKEMMELILQTAESNDLIRAVGMNGSRTNKHAPKDPFQDYDIVYFVTDKQPLVEDQAWLDVFGEQLIMQTPDTSSLVPSIDEQKFSYLMLFKDGSRIDLTLLPVESTLDWQSSDSLLKVLMDKDGIFPELPKASDSDYLINKPTQQNYQDCCNEFWWVSTYIAKGLWRGELLYALDHLGICRGMLRLMLAWQVGAETDFTVSAGKNDKHLERLLPETMWKKLLLTYPAADEAAIWQALNSVIAFFEQTSEEVAEQLNLEPAAEDTAGVKDYLAHVKQLPRDANVIY